MGAQRHQTWTKTDPWGAQAAAFVVGRGRPDEACASSAVSTRAAAAEVKRRRTVLAQILIQIIVLRQ